jgi:hypothetical protein
MELDNLNSFVRSENQTLKQTETGKKMFIRLYEVAKESNDANLENFCREVLELYEKYGINSHIEWKIISLKL